MKEENVREWGKIHPLGSLAFQPDCPTTIETSPTPENLIYRFTTTFALRQTERRTLSNVALMPVPKPIDTIFQDSAQALTFNYGHPRFIEYPEEEIIIKRTPRPVFSILLATMSVFTVWYIYHLTDQRLQLESQNHQYLETISQEQQAKAEMLAPQVKVLAFRELERSTVAAKLFWDTTNQTIQIYLTHLPTAAPDETFQLWYFTKDSKFLPVTAFKAADGEAAMKIKMPREDLTQVERIIVSLEPPGKYPFPVGQILLRGLLR
jgi:Anti-sigma-K factor rskA